MSRILILLITLAACVVSKPAGGQLRHHPAKDHMATAKKPVDENPLEIFGIRPGITFDSIHRIMSSAGATMREVREDTISHSYSDNPTRVYVIDSIICRLTYMRMAFVFDGANRLRRLTITPRESVIANGGSDDIENVLLLYFGQKWGKPELDLEPPMPMFRWQSGNILLRGFIRRGYPMWVIEG